MRLIKLPLKVAVPKVKRRTSDGIKRTTNKVVKGKVFKDEDGLFKISIELQNDTLHPDLLVLLFTERSYELKGRTNVFSRITDKHNKYVRFIRTDFDAKTMPGLPEQYIPFAPNWIVKGYIVSDNGIKKFDFKSLVGINGYDISKEL